MAERLDWVDPTLREWDSTAQVGPVEVVKVESKGRQNRRVRIRLTRPSL
jgi:Ser-tRNA(Ala) deacylase AlaX